MKKEPESPIIEQLEKEREKLLSFSKYLEINTRARVPTKITIEFENKRFGDKGFAVIEVPSSSRILKNLAENLRESTQDELDNTLTVLRNLRKTHEDDNG